MTTAQIVEMSVINSSLSKDYLHLDDHARQNKKQLKVLSCESTQLLYFYLNFVIFHDSFNIVSVFFVSSQAKHRSAQFVQ